MDYHQAEIGNNMRNSVEVTFKDSSGVTVNYVFDKNNVQTMMQQKELMVQNNAYSISAYPDSVGGYQMNVVLHPIQFDYGIYITSPLSGTSESIHI